jgi:hypothetical protein
MLRSAARHYFQPQFSAHPRPTHLVMKFRSFCIELAEPMEQATKGCTSLFLYRDIERVIISGMQAFRYEGAPLWVLDRWRKTYLRYPLLLGALAWNLDRLACWRSRGFRPWKNALRCRPKESR